MAHKLIFVPAPGAPAFGQFEVTGPAPEPRVGDFVEIPVRGTRQRFQVTSVLHRFSGKTDTETLYDLD